MSHQIIIPTASISAAAAALRDIWASIEVFNIDGAFSGISIPTQILDQAGDEAVREILRGIPHYNLWEG